MDMLNGKSLPRCNRVDLSAVTPSLFPFSMPLRPLIDSNPFQLFWAVVNVVASDGGLRLAFPAVTPLQQNTDQNF